MNACFVRWTRCTAVSTLTATLLAGCDLGGPGSPRIGLSPDTAVLAIHGRLQLGLTVRGLATTDVGFASSDTNVAVVDATGTVKAVGYGVAYVRAWSLLQWGVGDSVRVRVPVPAGPWLVVVPDSAAVLLGTWKQLTWRVGGTSGSTVRFLSSDTAIATVSDSGLVCPRALGRAVVHATVVSSAAASDSSRIFVVTPGALVDPTPPTASIVSIVDSAGRAVDPRAVRGTIRVIVRLDVPRCWGILTASLYIDGALAQAPPDTVVSGSTVDRTFTVDTRATDQAGQRLLPNGQHTLLIVLRKASGVAIATTSQVIVVANP